MGVRRGALVGLLVGVACAVPVAAGALGTESEAKKPRKPPPSQALIARRLASGVDVARTPAARYRALVAVLRELNVGLYTSRGRMILPGAKRPARNFHLYDFNLRVVADAFARDETTELAELPLVAPGSSDPPVDPEHVAD